VHEFLDVEPALFMQKELLGQHEYAGHCDYPLGNPNFQSHQDHLGDAQLARHFHHELANIREEQGLSLAHPGRLSLLAHQRFLVDEYFQGFANVLQVRRTDSGHEEVVRVLEYLVLVHEVELLDAQDDHLQRHALDLRLLVVRQLLVEFPRDHPIHKAVTHPPHSPRTLDHVGLARQTSLKPSDASVFGVVLPAEAEVDDYAAEGQSDAALSDVGGKDHLVFDARVEQTMVEFVREERVDFDYLILMKCVVDEQRLHCLDLE
jgi:hypothetical protein